MFQLAVVSVAGITLTGLSRDAAAQDPNSLQAYLGFFESEPEVFPLPSPSLPLSRSDGSSSYAVHVPRSASGITLILRGDSASKAAVDRSTGPDGNNLIRRAWSRMQGSERLHFVSFDGLGFGEHTIGIRVATDAMPDHPRTYLVTVTRAETFGSDSTLTGLSLSEGDLTPAFPSDTKSYVAAVPFRVTSLTLTVGRKEAGTAVQVRATASDGEELTVEDLTVSGLALGRNTIRVVATAEDGSNTETYTVEVVRLWPSRDTRLWDLSLAEGAADSFGLKIPTGGGILRPGFRSAIRSYQAIVPARATAVKMGILCPSQASLSQTGQAPDGTALAVQAADIELHSIQLDNIEMRDLRRRIVSISGLQPGRNTIEIRVTAEDGVTTGVYEVTVNRG